MRGSDRDPITLHPDGKVDELQPKWRQDFPIDIPQDEYVSRREFTKFLVLISFSFVVGQLWILAQNILRRSTGKPPLVEITSVNDLGIGATQLFHYPGIHDPCILVRKSDGNFVAYSQKCTHLSCPVLPEVRKGHFRCPCHEGYFEIETGTPFAGPPRRPLARVKLEIRSERIYASGMEGQT